MAPGSAVPGLGVVAWIADTVAVVMNQGVKKLMGDVA